MIKKGWKMVEKWKIRVRKMLSATSGYHNNPNISLYSTPFILATCCFYYFFGMGFFTFTLTKKSREEGSQVLVFPKIFEKLKENERNLLR